MPLLPLPPLTGAGVPIDSGDLPVSSSTDVAAAWSQDVMAAEVAPVRDAVVAGQTAALLEYQRDRRYAAAQSDPLRATGEYLDEIGNERGVVRQPGELGIAGDTTYRARVNARPSVVDPNDIVAAANAVLAPYTAISCRYAERSDGTFASAGDSTWSCHAFTEPGGSTPNYPDRNYAGIPNRRPTGCQANGDSYGRWFLLRVPDISGIDSAISAAYWTVPDVWQPLTVYSYGQLVQAFPANGFVYQCTLAGQSGSLIFPPTFPTTIGATCTDNGGLVQWTCIAATPYAPLPSSLGNFAGSGLTANALYAFDVSATADEVYDAVVAAVEGLRMHSVRWTLLADPNLAS